MDQPNPTSPIAPVPLETVPPVSTPSEAASNMPAQSAPVTPGIETSPLKSDQTVAAEIAKGSRGPNFKIILLIALGVVIALLGLLYFALLLLSKPQVAPIVKEKPKPVVVEEIIETPPSSKFASDSAVIQLRTDLQTLMGRIDTVDFFEAQVAPPAIDNAISIQP